MSVNFGPETFPYIIQADDTVWDLAERYDTTAEEIMAVNPGVDPDNLFVGQVIAVIGDPPSARALEFHRREFERRREFEFRPEFRRRRIEEFERRRIEEFERRRRFRFRY